MPTDGAQNQATFPGSATIVSCNGRPLIVPLPVATENTQSLHFCSNTSTEFMTYRVTKASTPSWLIKSIAEHHEKVKLSIAFSLPFANEPHTLWMACATATKTCARRGTRCRCGAQATKKTNKSALVLPPVHARAQAHHV